MTHLEPLEPLDQFNQTLQQHVHPLDWTNPKPTGRYHLVVIGAGTAGLVTAAGAAGLGAKVALIERGLMGGDCLNVGCVPSKSLLSAARMVGSLRQANELGVQAELRGVDFNKVMQRMRRLRAAISPNDSAKRFRELGVDVYFGQGTFTSDHTIDVAGQSLAFKKAVIATGARAGVPSIPGLAEAGYLTNETVFSLTALPRNLVVLGGGPIGCELAQCFARFGSEVTLIETGTRVLARESEDAALLVQQSLQRDGVRFLFNAKLTLVDIAGPSKRLTINQQGIDQQLDCEHLLIAAGRRPNVEGLGLDKIGVKFDQRQGVAVDDQLRTANRHVFAAGDVCSAYKFTHAADFQARLVIQNALFLGRSKASTLVIPWCTYTSPELAQVGLTPETAAQRGVKLTSFTQPLAEVDRAILDGETEGFVRVYCAPGSDRILGATIVAAHAGEMISEVVLAMKAGIGLKRLATVIHPYPTQGEALRKLGDQYNRTRLTPLAKSLLGTWLRWTR